MDFARSGEANSKGMCSSSSRRRGFCTNTLLRQKKNPSNFQSIGGLEHTCMKLHFLNKTYYFLLFKLPCSQMIFECFYQKKYYFWKTLECDVFLYPKFDTIVVKLLDWRFSNFAKKSAKIYEIRIHRWTQFLRGGRFSERFKFSFEILPCLKAAWIVDQLLFYFRI